MIGVRVSQSVSAHLGRSGLWFREAGVSIIVVGILLEAVEGREASRLLTIGSRRGLPKGRTMTDGRALPTKGNIVYSCNGGTL